MKHIKTEYHEKLVMRLLLMQNQLGNITGSIKHFIRNTVNISDLKDKTLIGHKSYAMTELSDLIMQTVLLSAELGYNFEDVKETGLKRYNERKKEFIKANKLHQWI